VVVDTSCLVAILTQEPGFHELNIKIAGSDTVMAAPSLVEASMVLAKHLGPNTQLELMHVLNRLGIEIAPFSLDQAWEAASAFERFGKGRHPAALNFGDCMVYALAKITGRPVLFTGNDFSQTDVPVA